MTINIELIEQAFDNNLDGADIAVVEENVNEVFTSLNSGNIRVAYKNGEEWIVNQWIKKAILLSFKLKSNESISPSLAWIVELNSSFCTLARLTPSITTSMINGLSGFFVIIRQSIFISGLSLVANKTLDTIVYLSLSFF